MLPSIVLQNARFNAVGVALFRRKPPYILTWKNVNYDTKCMFQRRRCCAFSAQFAINFGIRKRQSWYKKNVSTPSVLRFLSVIRHESPHYNHVFSKKAQHLWRWISLWTFTRGWRGTSLPRAIKNTTRTELHGETIMRVALLIIKVKMVCGISSCKTRQNTRPFDAFYRVKWHKSLGKMTQFVALFDAFHSAMNL